MSCTLAAGGTGAALCTSPPAASRILAGGDLLDLGVSGGDKSTPPITFSLRIRTRS